MGRVKIDKGYLSRIIKSFNRNGLTVKVGSTDDGRITRLKLTARGNSAFQKINKTSSAQIRMLLKPLVETERTRLLQCMQEIRAIMQKTSQQHDTL
jgi:DNA-binding MarR family transcriptional regulator